MKWIEVSRTRWPAWATIWMNEPSICLSHGAHQICNERERKVFYGQNRLRIAQPIRWRGPKFPKQSTGTRTTLTTRRILALFSGRRHLSCGARWGCRGRNVVVVGIIIKPFIIIQHVLFFDRQNERQIKRDVGSDQHRGWTSWRWDGAWRDDPAAESESSIDDYEAVRTVLQVPEKRRRQRHDRKLAYSVARDLRLGRRCSTVDQRTSNVFGVHGKNFAPIVGPLKSTCLGLLKILPICFVLCSSSWSFCLSMWRSKFCFRCSGRMRKSDLISSSSSTSPSAFPQFRTHFGPVPSFFLQFKTCS